MITRVDPIDRAHPPGLRGMTLIEVLLALVLLAFTSATVLALRPTTAPETPREALHDLLDLDALARSYSERRGLTSIEIRDGVVRLLQGWGPEGTEIRDSGVLLEGCDIILLDADGFTPISILRYDSNGRSRDYSVEIECGDAFLHAEVFGVSGWVEVGS